VEGTGGSTVTSDDSCAIIGFFDAAVMAVVERLDEPKLATLDHRHFSVVRPLHRESIALLPD
jgi:hypothetical protein